MKIAGSFVWIADTIWCHPEKWPADMPAGGKVGKTVFREHQLNAEEYSLTIPILEQRYPRPPKA